MIASIGANSGSTSISSNDVVSSDSDRLKKLMVDTINRLEVLKQLQLQMEMLAQDINKSNN